MALQLPVNRGYLNLLGHLRQAEPSLSPETIQAEICHYLIHLPSTQPTPTPLSASIIASPVWHPLSLKGCIALSNTFRTATRLKSSELKKRKRGLFDVPVSSDLASWTRGILAGLKDGDAMLRLTISGGILLGMKDLQDAKISQRLSRDVEESIVLAFAEVTDRASTSAQNQWANEFKHSDENSPGGVELSVLLAAQYFNLISTEALSALNLRELSALCLAIVEKGFISGNYLHTARESLLRDSTRSLTILPRSKLKRDIDGLLASESFIYVAFVCRLLARIIATLSDTSTRPRKNRELWELLSEITHKLNSIACRVEDNWRSSLLANVQSESQLEENTRELTEKIWTVLKTQLFSTLMLQQAILDTILFLPPPSSSSMAPNAYSASYLTSMILRTLCCLSFVIASFGGVTAGAANGSNGPAFPELKKGFYMSIDILSTDVSECESFVRGLIQDAGACNCAESTGSPFVSAKRSFVLACIEQFITVLDDSCIEEVVLPFCELHLEDPSQRQTYESAHSVMLSIFAAHAEKSANLSLPQPSKSDLKGKGAERASDDSLARRLLPAYAQSLLENAKEGGLTTPQLRLAYAALVRSTSTGRHPHSLSSPGNPSTSSPSNVLGGGFRMCKYSANADGGFAGDPALAWLCVEQLLQAIAVSSKTDSVDPQTRLALSLTLISLISNVSLLLLPRVLKEVERAVDNEADTARRRVLIENVFEEVLEKVGDGEREFAMKWWFERSKKWEASRDSQNHEQGSR